jgi:hypothetical protein
MTAPESRFKAKDDPKAGSLEHKVGVPEPQAAPAPGTAIVGTTTIDAIFTTVYGTRSANLGAATYQWSDFNAIQCRFASATDLPGQCSMILARFEPRAVVPSTITP